MRFTTSWALLALSVLLCAAAWAPCQQVVASDNADNAAYGPFPNNNWSSVNGGSGYNPWTILGDSVGGGRYMEGVGVNGRQVEGSFSFGLFATNQISSISRPLVSTMTGKGQFDIVTRFDVANPGLTNLHAVNLRAGNFSNTFGSGEQLAFGMIHTNVLGYSDFSGTHSLASFNAVSNAWAWKITFDTVAGTYSGSVFTNNGGLVAAWNGLLKLNDTMGPVSSFGVIDSGIGNVIFDVPQFSVPEPAAASIVALAVGALIFWRRRGNTEVNA
jgi:hypothetical protein